MRTVEYDKNIEKRVKFNKPFRFIDIDIDPIGDVIARLPQDERYLLWLDYDNRIQHGIIQDLSAASARLSSGSILLVTVDIEPPAIDGNGPTDWLKYYREECGVYLGKYSAHSNIPRSKIAVLNIHVLVNAIRDGLKGRTAMSFKPMYSFVYSDGHLMLTIGGMLANQHDSALLDHSDVWEKKYIRNQIETPYRILVPNLTRRERLYLDSHMPLKPRWRLTKIELSREELLQYQDVYQYLPTYAELML